MSAVLILPYSLPVKSQELIVWGVSYHPGQAPGGREWVSENPGIGFRKHILNPTVIETYVEVDYISRNSTGAEMALAGGGLQVPLVSTHGVTLLAGVAAGIVHYHNAWTGERHVLPAGYPHIGVRLDRMTLSLGYIPKIGGSPVRVYETFFSSWSYRF